MVLSSLCNIHALFDKTVLCLFSSGGYEHHYQELQAGLWIVRGQGGDALRQHRPQQVRAPPYS